MAQAKNIRLYTPAGEKIDDLALAEDYLAADKAGPFRVGRRALYYRDGGLKRYCIPLEQIDHAFTRVVACATHCCCGKMDLNTFRLVVCGGDGSYRNPYTGNLLACSSCDDGVCSICGGTGYWGD